MGHGFFVTGTDTGVGKTLVACALLRVFASLGKSTVGMKPVAAGSEGGRWPDVDALAGASSVRAPAKLVNPYAFGPAIAPHIAAALAGTTIEVSTIVHACTELRQQADVVIVEGVGGFLVPLNESHTAADLARRLSLPVVLVVGMRLGCLNHALLTRAQIEAEGLRCIGWVANAVVSEMPELGANIRALEDRLRSPLLGAVPFLRDPAPDRVARVLRADLLTEAAA
ncbi:MAG TPA: dethiobiotin synthase [Burkholderiales bacterium]|nr:dethiobiotin synthase [Burkholderiales bacterium]